jgi:hypothetical protein
MSTRYRVYVGTGRETRESKEAVDRSLKPIIEGFGGVTVTESEGSWVNGRDEIEVEVTRVYEFINDNYTPENGLRYIRNWASVVRGILGEDGILVTAEEITSELVRW